VRFDRHVADAPLALQDIHAKTKVVRAPARRSAKEGKLAPLIAGEFRWCGAPRGVESKAERLCTLQALSSVAGKHEDKTRSMAVLRSTSQTTATATATAPTPRARPPLLPARVSTLARVPPKPAGIRPSCRRCSTTSRPGLTRSAFAVGASPNGASLAASARRSRMGPGLVQGIRVGRGERASGRRC
jgi:hypothetical protein